MPTESACGEVEARLIEALLARREGDARDLAHSETCPTCRRSLLELRSLRAGLEAWTAEAPAPALAEHTRRAVAGRGRPATPFPALPVGFGRELVRLFGAALAPLPLVLLWNAGFFFLAGRLLGRVLPEAMLTVLGVGYAVAAAGWLALVYGSLPLVAHERARRRSGLLEASS